MTNDLVAKVTDLLEKALGAAHAGALNGGDTAYVGCLNAEVFISEAIRVLNTPVTPDQH